MKRMIKNTKEMDDFAKSIVDDIVKQETKGARVIALYGDLGSGKTTFVQGAAKALDIKEKVLSPTFIIMRTHHFKGEALGAFIHIDCYRLKDSSELLTLDWNELIKNPHAIIFVEWAERVEDVLPRDSFRISFEYIDESKRQVNVIEPLGISH